MWERRITLLNKYLRNEGKIARGWQKSLAQRYGVNKSVISRDFRWIHAFISDYEDFVETGLMFIASRVDSRGKLRLKQQFLFLNGKIIG